MLTPAFRSVSTPSSRTGVIAAMREELKPLLDRVRPSEKRRSEGCRIVIGTLGNAPVVVARSGEGREAARCGVRAIVDSAPIDRLLIVGVSGGLTDGLEPGSLVVGSRLVHRGEAIAPPDAEWAGRALSLGGVRPATLVTAPEILATPESKAALRAGFAGNEPAATDLETVAYAEAATARGLPWLAVRAISDAAGERLPVDFNRFVTDGGRLRRGAVVWHAVRHPETIRALWRMRSRMFVCAERLARFVERLLDADEEAVR